MRANEFITEEPRTAASKPEIVSVQDDGKTITIKVRGNDGAVRALSNSNPAVLQQQLNLKYGLRLPHSIAKKFAGMPAAMAEDQADNPDSWESQAADAERDEETAKMAAQDAEAGGLAEEAVDEDLSRRGFLKGAGVAAAAVAGAAGSAMAQSRPVDVSREFQNMRQDDPRVQHNKDIEEMTRAIYDQIVATRGQPIDRRQQQMWMTIAREKATEKLSKYTPGRSAPQSQSSGFPAQGSERRVSRNIDNFESQGVAEATGDEKFDTMMGQIQREPKYPDSQMPPTDVKDLYQWAVKNNKPYHKIFAEWANREGYKSVAPALQRAGDLDTEALDYWTPRVWKIYWGEVRGIDSEMPPEWSKKRVPDELRDYLETVFDAYDRIVFDWPTEYRQIGGQDNYAEGDLNEKSTSQAQFRTMAAAAHNPKFAKKVGISRDVAKEFHGADKKSNYKSLPRKAAEDASWGMAPESQGYKK